MEIVEEEGFDQSILLIAFRGKRGVGYCKSNYGLVRPFFRIRRREGMVIACAKGKLRGKQPKLSEKQQRDLTPIHATREYSFSDLTEVFSV